MRKYNVMFTKKNDKQQKNFFHDLVRKLYEASLVVGNLSTAIGSSWSFTEDPI